METLNKFFKQIEEYSKDIKKDISKAISEFKKSNSEAKFNISVAKIDCFYNNVVEKIKNKEKILVYGDYDTDGIFSTAMTVLLIQNIAKELAKQKEISSDDYLNFLRNNICTKIPTRNDGYGLKEKEISAILKQFGYTITCDNGTHSSVINYIRDKNYKNKFFVIDHHYNGDFRKDDNILNPNHDGSVEISTGILVYRLIEKINQRKNLNLDTMPDLATFTFVSDVANLNSNRDILEKGLAQINNAEFIANKNLAKMTELKNSALELAKNQEKDKAIDKIEQIQKIKDYTIQLENLAMTRRPLITKLVNPNGENNFISIKDLQFNIIPKINAVNRMLEDSSFLIKALLKTKGEDEYFNDVIFKLNHINNQRKIITQSATKMALNYLDNNNKKNDNLILVKIDDNLNGICGLVAQKIHDITNADVIVASKNPLTDKFGFSGRGLNVYKQLAILENSITSPENVFSFGGHLRALGGSIKNYSEFQKHINALNEENKFLPKIDNKVDLIKQENIVFNKPVTLEKYEELSKFLSEKTSLIPFDKKILANVIITSDMIENKESVLAKIPNSEFVSIKLRMDYLEEDKPRTEVDLILNSKDAKHLIEKCEETEKTFKIPTFFLELNNNYIDNEKNIYGGVIIHNKNILVDEILNDKKPKIKAKDKINL